MGWLEDLEVDVKCYPALASMGLANTKEGLICMLDQLLLSRVISAQDHTILVDRVKNMSQEQVSARFLERR